MEKMFARVLLSLLLGLIPQMADNVNESLFVPMSRALVDSGTHALIGVLTWLIIEPSAWKSNFRVLLLIASLSTLIDVDHFLVVRSWHLKDALQAPYRGLFHCSGLLLVLNLLVFCLDFQWGLYLLVSWMPHHLRDATRRGIYILPPQVHTKPLRNDLTHFFIVAFPWLISYLVSSIMSPLNRPIRNVFPV